MADCHLGAWSDQPELRALGLSSFEKAIDICIKRNVAFILISGDLFNTAIPSIEILKSTASTLNKAKESHIDIYIIPGSHDFSASGKTMLDVLGEAGLLKNVTSTDTFTIDKTSTKLIGIMGLRGGLEKEHYSSLNRQFLEAEQGFKIFLFHTAFDELKPKEMEKVPCMSSTELPDNFNYYAGGHVHYILETRHKTGKLVYPGPLFPNNFKELEELGHGGFYIIDDQLNTEYIPLKLKEILPVTISSDQKTPEQIREEISRIQGFEDKILLFRIQGKMSSGSIADIDFRELFRNFESAYAVIKNTSKLTTKEMDEVVLHQANIEDIESDAIKQALTNTNLFEQEEESIRNLVLCLNKEKQEGEKNTDFEKRVVSEAVKVLKLEGMI